MAKKKKKKKKKIYRARMFNGPQTAWLAVLRFTRDEVCALGMLACVCM